MKSNKFIWFIGMVSLILTLSLVSCEDEETTFKGDTVNLESLLTEAENLIANAEEGINAGDFQPGSKAKLQEVVDWVYWRMNNSESQDDLADAMVKLQKYIDVFKESKVAVAMPWIQQENDTYIQISDNIKSVLDAAWTIELKVYIVNLNSKGYSNNLFSAEQMGPDSGFGVRYFSNGNVQIVVGNEKWIDSGDQAGEGTMKSGEWMDVTMTNDGLHQELFVNGAKVAENEAAHLLARDVPFVIGNSPTWTDRVCNVLVKDFRIWDSVLDGAVIDENRGASFEGTESGLVCYFPFGSNLGSEFEDATGNYTATLVGEIDWVSEPPVFVLDYTNLNEAIDEMEAFKNNVNEGNNDGDHPVGTIDYIDELLAQANDALENEGRQSALNDMAADLLSKIDLINSMLVADANGVFIDRDDPEAVGLRITPNYTPTGDYTVEFDVRIESLFGYGSGEFFNNGHFGVWVNGYEELSEESVLSSGGLYHFVQDTRDDGWKGPKTEPLVMEKGKWQHVAVVHDEAELITRIYVDGQLVGEETEIGYPKESGWGEIWLGNGWGKMHGSIKDFRLWDTAKETSELGADIDGSEAFLQIYFPLDKVAGVKFNDVTGNYSAEMRGIQWLK